jgi:2-polyprenyl-6-methoxyphenol hydroxylase-like FAD-dependent oxidoreductase
MYRFMGQGAAQPIEDLAACLVAAGDADPAETLRNYERLRLPRLTLVQAMS